MTRRMLINAQRAEELRVAIVDGDRLENYQVEVADRGLTRGNIYRGRIHNVQPALNAAFIDYGSDRHGFMPVQDVVQAAWSRKPPKGSGGRPRIEDVLEKGQTVLVQVLKEPEGTKGAHLTTSVSLAGRYLVMRPFDPGVGVSRKVEDDEIRKQLRDQARKLEVPEGCGVIVRTNALDQTKVDLNRDVGALLRVWKQIQTESKKGKGPKLIYSDQDLILRALRDHLDREIAEVLVDDEAALARTQEYLRWFMPRGRVKATRYDERIPLFSKYDVERQIDRIYERRVELGGGGSLVIDRTEALTAIDVNSGRSTRGSSQEETALATNLEAAAEVARQLRLRDLGGLIVVDFIDMRANKNQRRLEKTLRDAMKPDKARFTVGRISPNGLLEINRQKIQQSLSMRTHRPCPTCTGTGRIASPEMVGLNLLRRIEARAASGSLRQVKIQLHPELADAFQNSRRNEIVALEEEFGIRIEVIASSRHHRSEQELDWSNRAPADVRPAPARPAVTPLVDASELAKGSEAAGGGSRRGRRRRQPARAAKSQAAKPAVADTEVVEAASDEGGEDGVMRSGTGRPRRRRRRRRRRTPGNGDDGNGNGDNGNGNGTGDSGGNGADG